MSEPRARAAKSGKRSERRCVANLSPERPGAGSMTSVVVRTEGLSKRYPGGLMAVEDLDLEVHEGDLFGFLGPNGAGKSTTIRMLLGLVFPTAGTVEVLGTRCPATAARRCWTSARSSRARGSTPTCPAGGT